MALTGLEDERSKISPRYKQGKFLSKASFGFREPPSGYVLTWPLWRPTGRERKLPSIFSGKGTNAIMRVLPSRPHLTFITSQRFYLQIASHWEFRASTYEFGRDTNIQPVTVRYVFLQTVFINCICKILPISTNTLHQQLNGHIVIYHMDPVKHYQITTKMNILYESLYAWLSGSCRYQ